MKNQKVDLNAIKPLRAEILAEISKDRPVDRIFWSRSIEGQNHVNGLPILMILYKARGYFMWYQFTAAKVALNPKYKKGHEIAIKYFSNKQAQ